MNVFVAELACAGRRAIGGRVPSAGLTSGRDRTAQAGWDLMNIVAISDEAIYDDYFEAQLDLVAGRIQGYGNWTRRWRATPSHRHRPAQRRPRGRRTEHGRAHRPCRVRVQGPRRLVMPDPIAYLEKTKAYREDQARKRAARAG